MKIFNIPYMWSIKTFFRNLISIFYSIRYGIKNIIHWFPIIWNDRNWDWVYLAQIMEFKLRNMSYDFKNYGNHVNSDRDVKNILICAELLKKLIEDNSEGVSYELHLKRMEQWQKDLGKMISKYFRTWWY